MRIAKIFPLMLGMILVLILSAPMAAGAVPPGPSSATYTVLVGWENAHLGVDVNAYFPDNLTIRVGDTVHWLQNTNEIHTVTFLAGAAPADLIIPAPQPGPSPLVFNPVAVNPSIPAGGLYDGTTYANSGLMGRDPGQAQEFSLTFTVEGAYSYMCLVHGLMMSGEVTVVGQNADVLSPSRALASGRWQIARQLAQVPAALMAGMMQIQPPTVNSDGTATHHVMIGYADGQIELMRFFPRRLIVRPEDTVVWEMSPKNDAPHTVTFLNGEDDPSLVLPSGGYLYLNPEVLLPQKAGQDLTRVGVYSSGLMNPAPNTTYTLVIGAMSSGPEEYMCLLHDTSGMKGTLIVVP